MESKCARYEVTANTAVKSTLARARLNSRVIEVGYPCEQWASRASISGRTQRKNGSNSVGQVSS